MMPSSPPRGTQVPLASGGCRSSLRAQQARLRAEFGEYPGREAPQEMGRAPEIGRRLNRATQSRHCPFSRVVYLPAQGTESGCAGTGGAAAAPAHTQQSRTAALSVRDTRQGPALQAPARFEAAPGAGWGRGESQPCAEHLEQMRSYSGLQQCKHPLNGTLS